MLKISAIEECKEAQYSSLSQDELVTFAMTRGTTDGKVSFEDLVAICFKLFPRKFES